MHPGLHTYAPATIQLHWAAQWQSPRAGAVSHVGFAPSARHVCGPALPEDAPQGSWQGRTGAMSDCKQHWMHLRNKQACPCGGRDARSGGAWEGAPSQPRWKSARRGGRGPLEQDDAVQQLIMEELRVMAEGMKEMWLELERTRRSQRRTEARRADSSRTRTSAAALLAKETARAEEALRKLQDAPSAAKERLRKMLEGEVGGLREQVREDSSRCRADLRGLEEQLGTVSSTVSDLRNLVLHQQDVIDALARDLRAEREKAAERERAALSASLDKRLEGMEDDLRDAAAAATKAAQYARSVGDLAQEMQGRHDATARSLEKSVRDVERGSAEMAAAVVEDFELLRTMILERSNPRSRSRSRSRSASRLPEARPVSGSPDGASSASESDSRHRRFDLGIKVATRAVMEGVHEAQRQLDARLASPPRAAARDTAGDEIREMLSATARYYDNLVAADAIDTALYEEEVDGASEEI